MTPRERVKRTIRRQPADSTPYSFDLTGAICNKVARYYHVEPAHVHEAFGDNLQYVVYGPPKEFEPSEDNAHRYQDEFGVIWDKSDTSHQVGDWGGILSHPLLADDEAAILSYDYPNPRAEGRFDHVRALDLPNSRRFVILGMTGLFDLAWLARGYENLLMDFHSQPDWANHLLDKALDFNLGIIEEIPNGVDGIRFGEDWGMQKNLVMGGSIWRQFLKPRLKEMYAAAKRRGLHVFIHSCGDIAEIIPDLIEIGVEVIHPVQPEVMDIHRLKQEYGKDICFYGGLGCQSTLPNGTVKDVLAEAADRIALFRDGGYIFGPAGAIPTEAKLENVVALIEFARNNYHDMM